MKKQLFRIALFATAVATIACTKSEIDDTPTTPIAGEQISVTATIAGGQTTRVVLSPTTDDQSNPIVKVDWSESGETFAVINGEATETFTQTEGNSFEGALPAGTANYIGIYPASAATDNSSITFDIASQTGALDENKTIMLSARTTDGLSYSFQHLTALLRPAFKVGENTLSREVITKVVVKNTTTARTINCFAGTPATDTTGDITITRTPSADNIYIYLCKGYSAGESIGVWVYTNEAGTEKWYEGAITVPEGKSLAMGNLYTPTIALTEGETPPNTIIYYASEKMHISQDTTDDYIGFGAEDTHYTHTFANGIGRIRTIDGSDWTSLPALAFQYHTSGNDIKIILPKSITKVEYRAFYKATSFTEVIMPGVEIIADPDDIGTANGVFKECTNLKRVYIPAIKSIGKTAFHKCTALEEVVLPTSGDGYIVGPYAFAQCSKLTNIDLRKATSISWSAFNECTSLTTVNLESAESIGEAAFSGCTELTSVNLPNVTDIRVSDNETIYGIDQMAFADCSKLATITLPTGSSYTGVGYTIMNHAFSGSGITTIDLSKIKAAEQYAFNNCSNLQSVTLPDTNYTLAYRTFGNCTSLATINNLSKATSLGDYCFYSCTSITAVDLSSATTLGKYCFKECSNLNQVYMSDKISTIGHMAFYNCSALESVTINRSEPPTIDGGNNGYYEDCFGNSHIDLKIYVPSAVVNQYREAWKDYAKKNGVKWGNGNINDIIVAITTN